MRLLLVEDEQSLREDITKKLQHLGYEVDACGDGETALEYLAVEYYDLVLLDLNLPKIDGMTLLRNFREENQETPILILSARSEINDKTISPCRTGGKNSQPYTKTVYSARCFSAMRQNYI